MDNDRLDQRKHGRQEATAIIELVRELLEPGHSQDWVNAFWEEIDEFMQRSGAPPKPSASPAPIPMTDAEAREFGHSLMPFGIYTRLEIKDVPLAYLDWWLGESQEFGGQMARFLKNANVAAQLTEELRNNGWRLDA